MVNPILPQPQPNTQTTAIPVNAFPGQKMERSQETPRPVVDRKQDTSSAREEVPREEIEKATEKLNRLMGIMDKRLQFRIHEETGRIMVKVIDDETGDVLDEIPAQRTLDILASFNQLVGLLVDKRV